MENEKEEKGFHLTEKGQQFYTDEEKQNQETIRQNALKNQNINGQQNVSNNKRLPDPQSVENKPLKNTEQVSRFIDEGNPNVQPVAKTDQNDQQSESAQQDVHSQKRSAFSSRPDRDDHPTTGSVDQEEAEKVTQEIEKGINEEAPVKPFGVDHGLAQEIKEDINTDATLVDVKDTIYVTVENTVATLTGEVVLEEQKTTAGNKAIAYLGSGKINNRINVIDKNHR